MSHSLRFLGLAVTAWVGVRAVSLGMVPGLDSLAFDAAEAAPSAVAPVPTGLPPVEPSDLAPPPPMQPAAYPQYTYPQYSYPPYAYPQYAGYAAPAYGYQPYAYRPSYPVARPVIRYVVQGYDGDSQRSAAPRYAEMAEVPGISGTYADGVLPRGGQSTPARTMVPATPVDPTFAEPRKFDRWQMSTWAMLRDRPGPTSLAANGTLGGSQGGTRILYRFNPRLAVSLRASAPINSARQAGEAALGVRYQPFASIPIALTAERRQPFGKGTGQPTFALFAEGGLYQRPVAAGFALDAYLQGGMVGPRARAGFVDGSATLTRPLWRNVSGGVGVWGGAQPGLTRLDVGPRVSMKVGRSMRAHQDYRYKAVGNALPGSGAVVTLAGDF
jgi:hypothetical protein